MKRLLRSKIFYYVIYSLLFFSVIFYLDSIPDHRVGYTDYDLYLISSIFPIAFILHGIISKVILKKFKFYLPLIITAILGFIEAFFHSFYLKISAMMTLYFVALTFVGVLTVCIILWIVEGIKSIKNWYK